MLFHALRIPINDKGLHLLSIYLVFLRKQKKKKRKITEWMNFIIVYDLIFISDVYDWSDDSDSNQIIPAFPNSWV
jgi:hypothetical protein